MNETLESFYQQIEKIIDPGRIKRHIEADSYNINTTGLRNDVAGVIYPKDEHEIVQIVQHAKTYGVKLYPISKGNNWGYGGKTPNIPRCVVIDMSRMSKILDFDRDVGVVTLQPGVTHAHLYDYLQDNKLEYIVPTIGAGPQASILGNALERGFGQAPIMDHFSAVISLKAVLSDGSIYTSALHTPNTTKLHRYFKWGVGPYIDGLFTQSNFGIVVEMSVRLMKKKEESILFMAKVPENNFDKAIATVLDISVNYNGSIGNIIFISNERIKIALDSKSNKYFSRKETPWLIIGTIYGDRGCAKAIYKGIRKKLKACSTQQLSFSKRKVQLLRFLLKHSFLNFSKEVCLQVEHLIKLYDLGRGKPTQSFLKNSAYTITKAPQEKNLNPDEDGVGLLWYAPLVPAKPEYVREFREMCKNILAKYNFKYAVSFSLFSHLCFDATLPIIFDKMDPEMTQNAYKCYEELFLTSKERGFIPYRVGIQGMRFLVDKEHTFWKINKKIKQALDPDNMISPGRYDWI